MFKFSANVLVLVLSSPSFYFYDLSCNTLKFTRCELGQRELFFGGKSLLGVGFVFEFANEKLHRELNTHSFLSPSVIFETKKTSGKC